MFARSKRHSCCALPRSHTCTSPLSFSSLQQLLLRLGGLQEPLRVSLLPSAACLLPCLQPVPSSGWGEETVASVALCADVCVYVCINLRCSAEEISFCHWKQLLLDSPGSSQQINAFPWVDSLHVGNEGSNYPWLCRSEGWFCSKPGVWLHFS